MGYIQINSELPADRYPEAHPVVALQKAFSGLSEDSHPVARQAAALATDALEHAFKHHALIDENMARLEPYRPDARNFVPGSVDKWNRQTEKFKEATTAAVVAAHDRVLATMTQLGVMQTALQGQIEAKAHPAPKSDAASTSIAAEIRAHYKQIGVAHAAAAVSGRKPETTQTDFVNRAIRDNDTLTLGALFDRRVPDFLVGVKTADDRKGHLSTLDWIQQKLAPGEYAQEKALAKTIDKLDTQRQALTSKLGRALQLATPWAQPKLNPHAPPQPLRKV